MAITIAQVPTYPAPGRKVRVTPTAGAGGNFARVWLTDAPLGSELREKIAKATTARLELAATDSGKAFEFTPDVGGAYVCTVQEYTLGATAHGGAYEGDPDGYQTETKVGAESTVYLYAGERLEQTIGAGADTAKLVVWIWNATIRQTTIAEHGEATPALYNLSSDRAKTAALSTTVATALTALVGQTATATIGTLATVLDNMLAKINAHMGMGATTHNAADADNDMGRVLDGASGIDGIVYVAQRMATALRYHMTNSADGAAIGGAAYHIVSTAKGDWANLPAFQSCGSLEQALSVIGSVWEAYEAHRVNTSVHGAADSTNTLSALGPLLGLHKAYAAVIRSMNPTSPASINSGTTLLVHGAGFRTVPDVSNAPGMYVSAAEPIALGF